MNFFKFRKLKKEIVPIIRQGGIGVLPTDTLYGLVGSALKESAVERIYAVRQRNSEKPCIILIGSVRDLGLFNIQLSSAQENILQKVWPGKISVILDCAQCDRRYLHRGTNSLAFRLPKEDWLRKILVLTGPLIAPSANPEGALPASDIGEARTYFGETIDFYVNLGNLSLQPSLVIRLELDGSFSILRGDKKEMEIILKQNQ
jgi:L-threonylcarbamoyladenylate synthase